MNMMIVRVMAALVVLMIMICYLLPTTVLSLSLVKRSAADTLAISG